MKKSHCIKCKRVAIVACEHKSGYCLLHLREAWKKGMVCPMSPGYLKDYARRA